MSRARIGWLVAALACVGADVALAQSGDERGERITRTSEGYRTPRAEGFVSDAAKVLRVPAAEVVTKPKGESRTQSLSVAVGDHWVYDAFVELDSDLDGDGHFHFLRVVFDVDSVYTSAWVFADLYLSADGETWEHFYSTDDFLVEGQTSFDEYEVETELVSGYPRGYYDVLIELYDADYVEYVDEFGPAQSPAMSLLPLEDQHADGIPEPPAVIIEDDGGGGAAGWLALLAAAAPLRRLGRGRPAPSGAA